MQYLVHFLVFNHLDEEERLLFFFNTFAAKHLKKPKRQ